MVIINLILKLSKFLTESYNGYLYLIYNVFIAYLSILILRT